MVFKEIEAKPEFIHFGVDGNITVSVTLIRKYWNNSGFTHIQLFHDGENKKVGFKPSKDKGYKLFLSGNAWRICCRPLTKIVKGIFKAEWNEKHGMLIIEYGKCS